MSLDKQFYGHNLKMADWIEESFDLIKPLVNKIEIPEGVKTTEFDYWMIGPLREKKGKLFLFGINKCAYEEEIRSINPTKLPELLIVTGFDTVRKVNVNRSATRIAQTLDCLLHGAYTDMPTLHIDSILGEIYGDD